MGTGRRALKIPMTTSVAQPDFNETVNVALKEAHREFLGFLIRRTASREEAEDILQDFYLKVVQNAQTIRNRGSLRSWLAQVALRANPSESSPATVVPRPRRRKPPRTRIERARQGRLAWGGAGAGGAGG